MARTEALLRHLESRGRLRGFFAILSVGCALASGPLPERSLPGLGALLGDSVGGSVDEGSIAWEPPENVLSELAFGRRVLFLGTAKGGGPRDLYRASVRLTPGGQPLAVASIENVTDTPDADELGLSLDRGVATFATVAFGRVEAATVLEVGARRLERADVLFDTIVSEVSLGRDERSLTLRLTPSEKEVRYDTARRTLASEPGVAHLVVRKPPKKRATLALADAAQSALGEAAVRTLASVLRRGEDLATRAVHAVFWRRPAARPSAPKARVADARQARKLEDVWPPPKIPARFDDAGPDEGKYRPLASRGAEPCLYRTFVRPDPLRPWVRAVVVAMDMRQLELGMVGGVDVPKPTSGPPGEGRLTGDRETLRRVVAVFGGGRAPSARFGMQATGRALAPPKAGAVSVVELAQGETLLGPWTFGSQVPAGVASFRQGLGALLDAGGRPRFGADGEVRRRSGLCATPAGHLYYAFGDALDERSLAATFEQAGCAYAVELGGGVEPAGMALADVTAPDNGRFTLVDPRMTLDAETVLDGSSRDFFYVALRDMKPRLPEGATWQPDPGTQPLPGWITGIFRTSVALGGLTVDVFAFEGGRVEWRLRPGVREPGAKGESWAGFLPDGDAERALATLELGHTTVTPRLGLALGTTTAITLKDSFATLVVAPTEPPRILAPGETVKLRADEQAVQLPLLADADGVTERARDRGDLRLRSALGVTRSGRVLVALARHDSSDPLAFALVEAGAERVVELDRGSHHPAFVLRAGTETPPTTDHDSTTLWALGRPMLPGARVTTE